MNTMKVWRKERDGSYRQGFLYFYNFSKQVSGTMIAEMIDGYYRKVITEFCPALSKKEETFSGMILSDMIRIYYRDTVPFYNIGQTIKIKMSKILYRRIITISG